MTVPIFIHSSALLTRAAQLPKEGKTDVYNLYDQVKIAVIWQFSIWSSFLKGSKGLAVIGQEWVDERKFHAILPEGHDFFLIDKKH
jgi:hypothetical protein